MTGLRHRVVRADEVHSAIGLACLGTLRFRLEVVVSQIREELLVVLAMWQLSEDIGAKSFLSYNFV